MCPPGAHEAAEEGQSSEEALLCYINHFKGHLSALVITALVARSGLDNSMSYGDAARSDLNAPLHQG